MLKMKIQASEARIRMKPGENRNWADGEMLVPNRADTWSRMVYTGSNSPVAPIDDPYQMFQKLYGLM